MLESLVYSPHNSIAVLNSVQKELNLSVWLSEVIVHHPQLKQLAKSLPGILVQDRAPKTVLCYVRAYQTWKKRGKNGLVNVMSLPYQLILVSLPCIWCILSSKGVQFHCLTLPSMELAGFIRKAVTRSWAITHSSNR